MFLQVTVTIFIVVKKKYNFFFLIWASPKEFLFFQFSIKSVEYKQMSFDRMITLIRLIG